MSDKRPITDLDLAAYVDGELDPLRRAEIEEAIREAPELGQRVERIAAQNKALRAAAAPLLRSDIPDRLRVARLFESEREPTWRRRFFASAPAWSQIAAALTGVFIMGGVGGWSLHRSTDAFPAGIRPLVEEAADNYAVYEPDRLHPVEISATNKDDLMHWVTSRLNRPVSAPETIAAYRLLGGRVVATSRGPAAMFMYDDGGGKRIVLMICPLSLHGTAPITDSAQGALSGVSWSDRGVGFSLVGATSVDTLHSLAESVRREALDKV